MNEIQRAISHVPNYARTIIDNTLDPCDALFQIDRGLTKRAFEQPGLILTQRNLPYLAQINDFPPENRTYIVDRLVNKLGGYPTNRTSYEVAGDVRMNLDSEIYRTIRTDSEQSGETERVRIGQINQTDREVIEQEGLTKRKRLGEFNQTKRKEIEESNSTERRKLEIRRLEELERLKYLSMIRIAENNNEKERYLSDNQLKGIISRAETRLYGIKTREEIRAASKMHISDNELRSKIFDSMLNYSRLLKESEMAFLDKRYEQRMDLVKTYLSTQVSLYELAVWGHLQMQLSRERVLAIQKGYDSEISSLVQKVIWEYKSVVEKAVENGAKKVRFSVDINPSGKGFFEFNSE